MNDSRIIVGVSGASGAIYAVRTVRALLYAGREVDLVISTFGARLLRDEAGLDLEEETFPEFLARTEGPGTVKYDRRGAGGPAGSSMGERAGPGGARHAGDGRVASGAPPARPLGRVVRYDQNDLGAAIASGSYPGGGMVVVPCSTKTLAGIAHGASLSLIERAAEVTLKERRRLVLVPREAPYGLIHLRNMLAVTEAGAIVVPASPAFYQKPETFEDLADFIAGRVLNILGVPQSLFTPWGMSEADER